MVSQSISKSVSQSVSWVGGQSLGRSAEPFKVLSKDYAKWNL